MPTKTQRYVQVHITAPDDNVELWRIYKKYKYNGLNATSMMMRNAMNKVISEDKAFQEWLKVNSNKACP